MPLGEDVERLVTFSDRLVYFKCIINAASANQKNILSIFAPLCYLSRCPKAKLTFFKKIYLIFFRSRFSFSVGNF